MTMVKMLDEWRKCEKNTKQKNHQELKFNYLAIFLVPRAGVEPARHC